MFEKNKRSRITVSSSAGAEPDTAEDSGRDGIRIEMSGDFKPKKAEPLTDAVIDRLEKKFSRFAIKNLMLYIVIGMGIVFAFDFFVTAIPNVKFSLAWALMFDRSLILKGQVWRLITFIFIPEGSSPLFIALELYISWMIGTALEREWGSFRFGLYYLLGVLGCIIAGCIAGYCTNAYLNLSLFLAYALFFPNHQFMVFFILPVKAKWLALIDAAVLLRAFIMGGMGVKLVIAFSLVNLIIFFGRDIVLLVKRVIKGKRKAAGR